jgi:hypothetical protein
MKRICSSVSLLDERLDRATVCDFWSSAEDYTPKPHTRQAKIADFTPK